MRGCPSTGERRLCSSKSRTEPSVDERMPCVSRELTKGTFLPQYRQGRWYRIMSAAFPMYALEHEAEKYIINYRQCYV